MISSLPSIVLSPYASTLISPRLRKPAYVFGILLQIAMLNLLTQASQIWHYYLFLFCSGTVNALSRPLSESLMGLIVEPHKRVQVFTRLGGISSVVLSIAPVAGGAMAGLFGYPMLFFLDALSFVIALAFIFPLLDGFAGFESSQTCFKKTSGPEKGIFPKTLKEALGSWYLLLIIGAIINAIEFKVFSHSGYSEIEIGAILGAWGIGSFLAVNYPRTLDGSSSHRLIVILYGLSLAAIILFPWFFVSLLSFVAAGFASTFLGGSFRAAVQNSIRPEIDGAIVWGIANRRLGVINLSLYALCGSLLSFIPVGTFALFIATAATLLSYRLSSLKVTYFPAKIASLARYRPISGRTRYFRTSLTNEVSIGSEKLRAP